MNYSIFNDTMVDMNWKEIEKASKDKQAILFPIGVIEEHGPHLPLGTDIYWSYAICKKVKSELNKNEVDSLIAPPYYWGNNHCTGGFCGTFSLKPETMQLVLLEIFENLHEFGFKNVYCFNYHGDAVHVRAIINSIKTANEKFNMNIRFVIEYMDLELYKLSSESDYLLVFNPDYPMELFELEDETEKNRYDIHAGAYETGMMKYLYPEALDVELAKKLKSCSLDRQGLSEWLKGGENTKKVVPLGYAGNPAGFEIVYKNIEKILDLQIKAITNKIINNSNNK